MNARDFVAAIAERDPPCTGRVYQLSDAGRITAETTDGQLRGLAISVRALARKWGRAIPENDDPELYLWALREELREDA